MIEKILIVIKSSIEHTLLPVRKTETIENISVLININGRLGVFKSIYYPRCTNTFCSDIKKLSLI